RRLYAGVCNQSNNNEFVNTVFLQLKIQIGVGETTGAPVLRRHNISRLRNEMRMKLAAPCTVFERLPQPGGFLDWRDISPRFVVSGPIAVVHGVDDPNAS